MAGRMWREEESNLDSQEPKSKEYRKRQDKKQLPRTCLQ
jgi:hypothetical protein